MLILLYIFDSLRRDFLGCYGDKGAMTPHLDRFAAQATRFTQAYAAAPWSKASGAALLTGEVPRAVQMRDLLASLPAGVPTLAEALQKAAFRTIAVTANPFIAHDFGLLRGFEQTVEAFRPGVLPNETFIFHPNHFLRLADTLSIDPSALVLARSPALHDALLDMMPTNEPTFALCWSMDTHAPFFVRGERSFFGNPLTRMIPAADAEWLKDGLTTRDMISLYRDMIAYNDAHFGSLINRLQARGLWEDALIIVAGDHGEGFGEHGLMGHTNGLWEEQISIPLLVKFPKGVTASGCPTSLDKGGEWMRGRAHDLGIEAQVCDIPASLMDVSATIAELTGVPLASQEETGAISYQRLLAGEKLIIKRPLLLENPTGWALRMADWKAIAATDNDMPLLFNLQTDPHERHPLRDAHLRHELTTQANALRTKADQRAAQWQKNDNQVDDAVLERLRALGYW